MASPHELQLLADAALEVVADDMVVGLGSGHATWAFVAALGRRVQEGLRIRGIVASRATEELATRCGIPLVTLDDVPAIDVTVDGADEVDPQLNLIKGLGGAAVREKIVAAASRRLVILVGAEKLVAQLGQHGVLPLEVVPFGLAACHRRIAALGFKSTVRQSGGAAVMSDNGNFVVDMAVPELADPAGLEQALRDIPGMVGTGLFLGMADTVYVERGEAVEIKAKDATSPKR
jgi:ribose 5-phosphate isomerase A